MSDVRHCTPDAWLNPGKKRYGILASYRLAAQWLGPCKTVADWGGGGGYFRDFLKQKQVYTLVDGTDQGVKGQVLADLINYREPSEGILLRHVIDCTPDWRPVLRNALDAFTKRLVVITSTPESEVTRIHHTVNGWPFTFFNHEELIAEFHGMLRRTTKVNPSDEDRPYYETERIYMLERTAAVQPREGHSDAGALGADVR